MKREDIISSGGYIQLQYLEKQDIGNQYIDTGFVPNENTRIVIDFSISKLSTLLTDGIVYNARGACIPFGQRYIDLNNQFFIFIPVFEKTSFSFRYANYDYAIHDSNPVGHNFTLDANKNVWKLYKDGSLLSTNTFTPTTISTNLSILLFNCNSHSTYSGAYDAPLYGSENDCKMKISRCEIYDNGTLVRNYTPVLINGAPAMLDLVNNVPYYNNGTGEFLYA